MAVSVNLREESGCDRLHCAPWSFPHSAPPLVADQFRPLCCSKSLAEPSCALVVSSPSFPNSSQPLPCTVARFAIGAVDVSPPASSMRSVPAPSGVAPCTIRRGSLVGVQCS